MAEKKPMGVGGVQEYGTATGKPESTSQLKTGGDLRSGGGKKK
jgi:hypothetical protein